MSRQFTDEEIQWLLVQGPVQESHAVTGSENLAACETCDWTAQADTIDYLMEQVTDHLEGTYQPLSAEDFKIRRERFMDTFGWDPWEGVEEPTVGGGLAGTSKSGQRFEFMHVEDEDPETGDRFIEHYKPTRVDGGMGGSYDEEEVEWEGDEEDTPWWPFP